MDAGAVEHGAAPVNTLRAITSRSHELPHGLTMYTSYWPRPFTGHLMVCPTALAARYHRNAAAAPACPVHKPWIAVCTIS